MGSATAALCCLATRIDKAVAEENKDVVFQSSKEKLTVALPLLI